MKYHVKETVEALNKIAALKGKERAQLIEQILRAETRHFESWQWNICKSPGMELGKWQNLDEASFGTVKMKDNHLTGEKQIRTFIKWNSVYDFCLYLSDYIDRHNGNYARWNSIKPDRQSNYEKLIKSITPRFTK